MTSTDLTIPEPTDGARVVAETGEMTNLLRLYWRDDAEAAGRTNHADERWFDDYNADPISWNEVCRYAERLFLADRESWKSLPQPKDPSKVRVRLVVERVVRDVEYDRDKYEQAKAANDLDHLIDMDVSNMDGESVVVEADGTEIRPF
jgi:hypothetical protein